MSSTLLSENEFAILQRRLLRCVTGGALVVAVLSAVAAAGPLASRLHEMFGETVLALAASRAQSVAELTKCFAGLASQISANSAANDLLDHLNARRMSGEVVRRELLRSLGRAVKLDSEHAGVTRLNRIGAVAGVVGIGAPREAWPVAAADSRESLFRGPVEIEGVHYVAISVPVIGRTGARLGTDIHLFGLHSLVNLVTARDGLGESGEVGVVFRAGDEFRVLAMPDAWESAIESVAEFVGGDARDVGPVAAEGRAALLRVGPNVIGFAPVRGAGWSVVVRLPADDVFSEFRDALLAAGAIVLLLTIAAAAGIHLLIRPMSSGILLRAGALQREVEARTAELRQANERQRASLAMQEAVLTSADTTIITTDRSGRVTLFNDAAEVQLGYCAAEVIGQVSLGAFHQPGEIDDSRASAARQLGRSPRDAFEVVAARALASGRDRREWTYVRRDGTTFPALVGLSTLRAPDGDVLGFLAMGADITEMKEAQRELERFASTDGLTGVLNRRHFMHLAKAEFDRASRYQRDLSVVMIDADHFKAVNDRYGHDVGDAVLVALCRASGRQLREQDMFTRLGGEEFAALLPETGAAAAAAVAERLRSAVAGEKVLAEGQEVRFTISVGVASRSRGDESIAALLRRADAALYRAKDTGRNRVAVAA